MQRKNGWFTATAILSIISTVGVFFSMIMIFYTAGLFKSGNVSQFYPEIDSLTPDEKAQLLAACKAVGSLLNGVGVFLIFAIAGNIFSTVVYFQSISLSYDQLREHKGKVITAIVFSFICGGVLIGIFALLGYLVKPENEQYVLTDASQQIATPVTNTQTTVAQPAHATSAHKSSTNDLNNMRETLTTLKSMFDEGLINEEEYNKKRSEILKNF